MPAELDWPITGPIISFDYVNYRGEASVRWVSVRRIRYGSSEWHKKDQWLLGAVDVEKDEYREFAMKDMRNISEADPHAR